MKNIKVSIKNALNVTKQKFAAQNAWMTFLLAFLSSLGIYFYYEFPWQLKSSSFLMIFAFVFFYIVWKSVLERKFQSTFLKPRYYIVLGVLSFVFALLQFVCKFLDNELTFNFGTVFVISLLFALAIYPLLLLLFDYLNHLEIKEIEHCSKKMQIVCFVIICISWLFVWLAAFPGIYANDAPHWYFEFADKDVPITTKWSPVYASIFYFFVNTGYALTNTYESGLAVFTFLQMCLILFAVYEILSFCFRHGGKITCILSTVFLSLPTHAILAVQTSLDAPFMTCFAIILKNFIEIMESTECEKSIKKYIKLSIFIILAGVFRDNGFLTFCLVLPFILLVKKGFRKRLFISCLVGVLSILLYKMVLLPCAGTVKNASAGITFGVPLQLLSATYNRKYDKLNDNDKVLIEEYITKECLQYYYGCEQINDWACRKFNEKKFKENPMEFFSLYIRVGLKFPKDYIYAFLMQDLGMFFMDKKYPEHKIWHAYIDYSNYFTKDTGKYIGIKRKPLFPVYDKFLLFLFGDSINGYGGAAKVSFPKIPFFSILCRASTYFWSLILLSFYSIFYRKKSTYFILCLSWCFVLTIILAPLVMYRYWAPIIFSAPILLCEVLVNRNEN